MAITPARLFSLPSHLRLQVLGYAASRPARPICPPTRSLTKSYATYNTNFEAAPAPSSVNHEEVSHFNALASSWWDPHGSSRLLHLMNPLRHDFLRQCLDTSSVGGESQKLDLLDIGCGAGIFAESAARRKDVLSVTAIDPTPGVIAVARQHQRADPLLMQPRRLTYQNNAVEDVPAEKRFDVISLFEVVEHIRSPSPFLRTCLEHLKPGGWLVGSTIARTGVSWLTTKFVAEDVLRMVPRGTHEWNQYINPSELKDWASKEDQLDHGAWQVMGVVYVPGVGWKKVGGSEDWGNYFFGLRKKETAP